MGNVIFHSQDQCRTNDKYKEHQPKNNFLPFGALVKFSNSKKPNQECEGTSCKVHLIGNGHKIEYFYEQIESRTYPHCTYNKKANNLIRVVLMQIYSPIHLALALFHSRCNFHFFLVILKMIFNHPLYTFSLEMRIFNILVWINFI